MSRILVTGGAGFIGSHLLSALLRRGEQVVCLDNFDLLYPRRDKERHLAALESDARLRVVEGDIRDCAVVDALFTTFQPEIVIHLAAKAGVQLSIADPAGYLHVNVAGTINLLQAAVKHGVGKFVFISSSSVYGGLTAVPFREDQAAFSPLSPYAASKLSAESFCHAFHHLHNLRTVILRLFTVYGPRQRPDLAISKFTRLLLADQPLPLFGDGHSSRDYTHVDDVVRGIMAAAESDLSFATINLGRAQPVSLLELVALLGKAVGVVPKLEFLPAQSADMPCTYADITRARDLLNWQPCVELAEGLRNYVEYLAKTDN